MILFSLTKSWKSCKKISRIILQLQSTINSLRQKEYLLTFNNQRQKSQQHTLHFLTDDKLHMNKLTLKLLRKEKVYLWPSYTCIQIHIVLEVFCVNNNDYIFNNLINKSVILLHIFQHEYWNFNYNWVLYKFIEKTIRKIWRTLFDIGKFSCFSIDILHFEFNFNNTALTES